MQAHNKVKQRELQLQQALAHLVFQRYQHLGVGVWDPAYGPIGHVQRHRIEHCVDFPQPLPEHRVCTLLDRLHLLEQAGVDAVYNLPSVKEANGARNFNPGDIAGLPERRRPAGNDIVV